MPSPGLPRRSRSVSVSAVAKPIDNRSAAEFLPENRTLASLSEAAESCEGCDLYQNATQTVFGEGANAAAVMLVGEQPGDIEDRQGHPFVGPAGRMLDKALVEAGIHRSAVYVTNAVKHFKFVQRGKRRMHQKPSIRQVIACKPWLQAEIDTVQPKVIVCLGGTAAQAILGRAVKVTQERGKFFELGPRAVFITIHPSSILRQQESSDREREYAQIVAEMKLVRGKLEQIGSR
jgi:uracil-DNA glycosylase family protein